MRTFLELGCGLLWLAIAGGSTVLIIRDSINRKRGRNTTPPTLPTKAKVLTDCDFSGVEIRLAAWINESKTAEERRARKAVAFPLHYGMGVKGFVHKGTMTGRAAQPQNVKRRYDQPHSMPLPHWYSK